MLAATGTFAVIVYPTPILELLCIKPSYVKGNDSNTDCIALNDWTRANRKWKRCEKSMSEFNLKHYHAIRTHGMT